MTRLRRRIRDAIVGLCMVILAALIVAKLDQFNEARLDGPFFAIDGDTLAAGAERLRLRGIDAPERHQLCGDPGAKAWACGEAARQALAGFSGASDLVCVGAGRDRYRRLLVTCSDGNSDINGAMVRLGLAVSYGDYQGEEQAARLDGKGLWSGAFERPQDWRRRQQLADEAPVAASLLDGLRGWLSMLGR
ncbi:MAG: thermonuclease family protein [Allorhizobium sp.]